MFGKLAEAQQKAEEIKKRLEAITVEGTANGVTVLVTGNKNIKHVNIDPSLLTPERKEELEDLMVIAIERAMLQAENISASEMKSLMGSMLPDDYCVHADVSSVCDCSSIIKFGVVGQVTDGTSATTGYQPAK